MDINILAESRGWAFPRNANLELLCETENECTALVSAGRKKSHSRDVTTKWDSVNHKYKLRQPLEETAIFTVMSEVEQSWLTELCCFSLHQQRSKCLRTWTIANIWGPEPPAKCKWECASREGLCPQERTGWQGRKLVFVEQKSWPISYSEFNQLNAWKVGEQQKSEEKNCYKWRLPLQGSR